MLNRDYILRLIEEVVRAITKARDLRGAGALAEATNLLDETCTSLTGLSVDAVLAMPLRSLTELLHNSAGLDIDKVLTLAQLLSERALLSDARTAVACNRRALCLYDEVTQKAPQAPQLAAHEQTLAELLRRLA